MSGVDKFGRKLEVSLKKSETLHLHAKIRDGLLLDEDNHYNARNKRIKLIHDPLEKQDVVTKSWAEKNFIKLVDERLLTFTDDKKNGFSFSGKTLSDVGEPINRRDVVTFGVMKRDITRIKESLEKEIKDRTEALSNQLHDELRTINTAIGSLNTLLRQSVKNTAKASKLEVRNDERRVG